MQSPFVLTNSRATEGCCQDDGKVTEFIQPSIAFRPIHKLVPFFFRLFLMKSLYFTFYLHLEKPLHARAAWVMGYESFCLLIGLA